MNAVVTPIPDLSAFDVKTGANAGYALDLLDAHNRKTGLTIRVLGRDSTEYQKVFKEQGRQRLHRMQKTGSVKLTQDELDEDSLDLLAAVTKEWNFKAKDGSPYPCTPSNAINLYRDFPYIREQVETATNDRENFIKS